MSGPAHFSADQIAFSLAAPSAEVMSSYFCRGRVQEFVDHVILLRRGDVDDVRVVLMTGSTAATKEEEHDETLERGLCWPFFLGPFFLFSFCCLVVPVASNAQRERTGRTLDPRLMAAKWPAETPAEFHLRRKTLRKEEEHSEG